MGTLKLKFSENILCDVHAVKARLYDAFINFDDPIDSDYVLFPQVEALNFAFEKFGYESVAELRMGEVRISGGQSMFALNLYEEMKVLKASPADVFVKDAALLAFINDVAFMAVVPEAAAADHDFLNTNRKSQRAINLPWLDL